jgi:pimeloyl-ACP methyl ester carboxylesterase
MLQQHDFFINDNAVKLLVFLPGMTHSPKDYASLFEQFKTDQNFSQYDAIGYGFRNSYFSNSLPDSIAEETSKEIENIISKYSDGIILVGHSVGGLLVRKCLLAGIQSKYLWPGKVNRLILLSSTNRGFVPRGFLQKAGLMALKVSKSGELIQSAQRGSDWINGLRFDWSLLGGKAPYVVQIRGKEDEVVEADDSADLLYFPNAHEVLLDEVNHRAFCRLGGLTPKAISIIKDCFFKDFPAREPERMQTLPSMLIFLVHGIRDYAEWQEALSQEIAKIDKNAMVIPVQYGYFNAFQFLSPLQRNRASRIFADKYLQATLKYPNTEVAIAAHSNGTYAVAQAFLRHTFIKADRLYLAGSVLPQKFDWTTLKNDERLDVFRNDIANLDWPVGLVCNAIKWIDPRIGVGGFHGFTKIDPNNMYLQGSHGAALAPPYRSEVAKFLVSGKPEQLTIQKVGESPTMKILSILALPILLAVLAVIMCLYGFIAANFSAPFAVIASALLTVFLIVGLSSL